METIAPIIAILAGLVLGSFFNVLIWRLPREESIISPPSHCPKCGRMIRPWENIPVLSYAVLLGRCAGCRQRISPVYPLIELLSAAASLVLLYTVAGSFSHVWYHDIHLGLQYLTLMVMIPVAVIDWRHYIIPDAITLSLLPAALCASFFPGDTTPLQSALGIVAGGATLIAIGWIGKIVFRKGDAMGMGDVKLMALAGAMWGPKIAFLTIFFASFFGTIGAVAMLFARRLGTDHRIPFGPFLSLGLWTAVLAGDRIVTAYMDLIAWLFYKG